MSGNELEERIVSSGLDISKEVKMGHISYMKWMKGIDYIQENHKKWHGIVEGILNEEYVDRLPKMG